MFLFDSSCKSLVRGSLLFLLLALVPVQSFAEPLTYVEDTTVTAPPAWWVSVGGGAMVRPEFEGSDKYNVRFIPIVHAQYKNRVFLSSADGLGVYLYHNPDWNVGAVAKYNQGRKESASTILRGMGDIDPGADIGVFGTWTPSPFSVRLEVLQGTGDVEGVEATLTAGHVMPLLQRLQWTNSIGATYGSADRNDTFFGVSRRQSERSGHNRYSADDGFKSVQFGSRLNYQFTDTISGTVFGGYKRLTGPAEDSPLVKAGSPDQGSVGVGLVYTFTP